MDLFSLWVDFVEVNPRFSAHEFLELFFDFFFTVASFFDCPPKFQPLVDLYFTVVVFVHCSEELFGVQLGKIRSPKKSDLKKELKISNFGRFPGIK
jgi:hypothetical protein